MRGDHVTPGIARCHLHFLEITYRKSYKQNSLKLLFSEQKVSEKQITTGVRVYLTDEELGLLDDLSEKVNLKRHRLLQQIFRKHVGLPSLLQEAED